MQEFKSLFFITSYSTLTIHMDVWTPIDSNEIEKVVVNIYDDVNQNVIFGASKYEREHILSQSGTMNDMMNVILEAVNNKS